MVFTVFLLNAIFFTVVYICQSKKDILYMKWYVGALHTITVSDMTTLVLVKKIKFWCKITRCAQTRLWQHLAFTYFSCCAYLSAPSRPLSFCTVRGPEEQPHCQRVNGVQEAWTHRVHLCHLLCPGPFNPNHRNAHTQVWPLHNLLTTSKARFIQPSLIFRQMALKL